MRIGQDMAVAPCFCEIRRVRTGVATQKRLERSRCRSRLVLIVPRRTCHAHELEWNAGGTKTDNRAHSANRLQHVEPLPHRNSLGMNCHGVPVFRTKMIPARVLRCGTGGRPPFDDFGGSGGSNGSICCHSVSDTNSAIGTPPCFSRLSISSKLHQFLK